MSGNFYPNPPPFPLGSMGAADSDGPWQVDCTANMYARGTTITSIGSVITLRVDAQATGASDIAVTGTAPAMGGLAFTFSVQARGNVAQYLLGFPLTLANGDTITRWGLLSTISYPG